jgi:hypothetical protein
MVRADEHLDRYVKELAALRAADAAGPGKGADYAFGLAAFTAGFMFGAGMPGCAATVSHLYLLAYPGQSFPLGGETT